MLSIPQVVAHQFVPGTGNEGFHIGMGVYQKAQAAGRAIQVSCSTTELDLVMETLDPRGPLLTVSDDPSRADAGTIADQLTEWFVGQFR